MPHYHLHVCTFKQCHVTHFSPFIAVTTADDSTTTPPQQAKKFRRIKKPKEGREPREPRESRDTKSARAPSHVTPELYHKNPPKGIEVQPALSNDHETNFSTNNSNELPLTRRSGSRHGIELPPLIAPVGTPRGLSLDGSDSEDKERKKEKRKKKHHRKSSQQTLVDAEGGDDDNAEGALQDDKSLSPLPEQNDYMS